MAFRLIVACALLATVYGEFFLSTFVIGSIFNFFNCILFVGASLPSFNTRIVGGDDATIEEYPWQCSIQSDDEHIGSAAILTRRHAVTAASALSVDEVQSGLLVRCGSTNRTSGGTVKALQRVVIHEQFDAETLNNDIALLVFKYLLEFGTTIQPIRVAGSQLQLQANTTLLLSGWASPEEEQDPAEVPTSLQAIELSLVEQAACNAAHPNFTVSESHLCANDASIQGNSVCNVSGDRYFWLIDLY